MIHSLKNSFLRKLLILCALGCALGLVSFIISCNQKKEDATEASTTTTTLPVASFALDSVSPALSNTLGGITVTLTGSGFASGASVTIGGVTCTDIIVVSATTITCTVPTSLVGVKDVILTQSSMTQTLANSFTVKAVMALGAISSNKILLYTQDFLTGALTLQSSTASSGSSPRGIFFAKKQRLYVLNSSNSRISAYSFEMSTYALTELSGSPYTVGGCTAMKGGTITPDLRYLYVSCETSNKIYVYNVASDGTLSANGNGPYTVTAVRSININAAGTMLIASGYTSPSTTNLFNINTDGSLTAFTGNPYATGGIVTGSAIYDNHFYSPNWEAGMAGSAIRQFSFTSSSLTALTPATVATSTVNGYAVDISPDGKWAAAACEYTSGALLNIYARSTSTGLLTPLASSPITTGTAVSLRAAVYDPASAYLYVVGSNTLIYGYSVNQSTGATTILSGFPMSLGADSNVYRIDLK